MLHVWYINVGKYSIHGACVIVLQLGYPVWKGFVRINGGWITGSEQTTCQCGLIEQLPIFFEAYDILYV